MGLDCYVLDGEGGGRISSYTGVHTLRVLLIEGARIHCEKLAKKSYPVVMFNLLSDDPKGEKGSDGSIITFTSLFKKLPELVLTMIINYLQESIDASDIIQIYDPDNYDSTDNERLLWLGKLLDTYKSWLKDSKNPFSPINYEAVKKSNNITINHYMSCLDLIGIYKFVDHSDCEGSYSAGDCYDISTSIKLLLPYIDKDHKEWVEMLEGYFSDAWKQGKPLIYS